MSRFHVGKVLPSDLPADELVLLSSDWPANTPLLPGERFPHDRDSHVSEQLSTADGAVAAWVATGETLRDPGLAFAVVRRHPDVDAFPVKGATLDKEAARAAVRDLRAGKPVATSIVVRLACHMLETR